MARSSVHTLRCEALFASPLASTPHPAAEVVRAEILHAIMVYGLRGCAARVAREFGDRPEGAMDRMRWARQAVAETYPDTATR